MWNHIVERHESKPGADFKEESKFCLIGLLRDCKSRHFHEAERLKIIQIFGQVLNILLGGVGGNIVEILSGREECFQPEICQHMFHRQ